MAYFDVVWSGPTVITSPRTVGGCANFYHGSPSLQMCPSDYLPITVSGCFPDACVHPIVGVAAYDITGVIERSLHIHNFSVTDLNCAADHVGTVVASKCTVDGSPYAVSGCRPAACVRPIDQMYNFSTATETSLEILSFTVHVASCAANHHGTPVVTPCAADGLPYTVQGCNEITCSRPDSTNTVDMSGAPYDHTVGYDLSAVTEHHVGAHSFNVSGVVCATGYSGTPSAAPCPWKVLTAAHPSNSPYYYTLNGCIPNSCAATAAANSSHKTPGSITGVTGASVSVLCDVEFAGGGDWTCMPNGSFVGTGCAPLCDHDQDCCGRGLLQNESATPSCQCDLGRQGSSCDIITDYEHRMPGYNASGLGDWTAHSMTIAMDGPRLSTRIFVADLERETGLPAGTFVVFDVTYLDGSGRGLRNQLRVHVGTVDWRAPPGTVEYLYNRVRDTLEVARCQSSSHGCTKSLGGVAVLYMNVRMSAACSMT